MWKQVSEFWGAFQECLWDACVVETAVAISVTDLALASLAGAAAAITTSQALQRSNWVEPNIYNSQPADETNLNPNGPPPKGSPKWKKTGAVIGGVIAVVGAVLQPIIKYDEDVNPEPKNKGKKGEVKGGETKGNNSGNNDKNKKENKPQSSINKSSNQKTNYPAVKDPYQKDTSKKPANSSNNNCSTNKKDKH